MGAKNKRIILTLLLVVSGIAIIVSGIAITMRNCI